MNTASQSPILGLVAGKTPTPSNRTADAAEGDFAGLLADTLSSPVALAVASTSNPQLADIGQFGLAATGGAGGTDLGADALFAEPGPDAALLGSLLAQTGGVPAVPGQAGIEIDTPPVDNPAPVAGSQEGGPFSSRPTSGQPLQGVPALDVAGISDGVQGGVEGASDIELATGGKPLADAASAGPAALDPLAARGLSAYRDRHVAGDGATQPALTTSGVVVGLTENGAATSGVATTDGATTLAVRTAGDDRALTMSEHLVQLRSKNAQKATPSQVGAAGGSIDPADPGLPPSQVGGNSGSVDAAAPIGTSEITSGPVDRSRAAVATPSAHMPTPPSSQVAVHITRAIPQGMDRFSVQLHPAELGGVEIHLDFGKDGRVSALITTERPETLELLQRDSRAMERSLNDGGVKLDNGGLTFSLKQEQQQDGRGFNPFGRRQASGYSTGQESVASPSFEVEPAVRPHASLRLLDVSA